MQPLLPSQAPIGTVLHTFGPLNLPGELSLGPSQDPNISSPHPCEPGFRGSMGPQRAAATTDWMTQVPDIAGTRGQMATVSAKPLCTNPPHLASPLQCQQLCPARLLVPACQSAVPGPALSPHQENGHAAGAPAGLAGTWGLLACKSGRGREGKGVPGQDQDGHSSPAVLDC